jgi:hypothetical protein
MAPAARIGLENTCLQRTAVTIEPGAPEWSKHHASSRTRTGAGLGIRQSGSGF